MKPHIVKFLQFLEDKEGKNAPLRLKLLNQDGFKFTKDELNVRGNLILSNNNVTSLPIGLQVGKSLYLNGCTSLKSLPDGLKVGWSLYLSGCTSLKSLPDGLKVGWSLYLYDTPLAKLYSEDEIRTMIEANGGYVGKHISIYL